MSNLPPGCSFADIDRAYGYDQPALCEAQSPEGRFACTINLEAEGVELDENEQHTGEHVCHQEVMTYSREPACGNQTCPNPNRVYEWPCDHIVTPGAWVTSDDFGGSGEFVAVARWPRRADDFDDNGNPTSRKAVTA